MEGLHRILEKYTDPSTGSLHGAAFIVVDKTGRTIYEHAAGILNIRSPTVNRMQTDSLCWIASMTKVVTAVTVLQLVERGIVALDDDVRDSVNELKDLCVLQGFEDERPILESIEGKLTIRHLLSHTSGFVYDGQPLLKQWSKVTKRQAHTFCGSLDGYRHPLIFQPGRSWGYGGGIDWAGRMVENVSHTSLEDYMDANIWSPLDMKSTTFHPERYRATLPPQLDMGLRSIAADGSKSVEPGKIIMKYPLEDDIGGIGLFSTAKDFAKLLAALLCGGYPVLGSSSVDLLFEPQLDASTRAAMPKGLGVQSRRVLGFSSANDPGQADHCLAGTITLTDIPGRRRKGSVNWSGLPNLHWWIDRKEGIAATLFTQLMPPGDATVVDLLLELEEALYQHIRSNSGYADSSSKL